MPVNTLGSSVRARRPVAVLLALVALVGAGHLASAAPAEAASGWYEITGQVVTNGAQANFPVNAVGFTPGAESQSTVFTDSSGRFQLIVRPGTYTVQVLGRGASEVDPGWADTYLGEVAFKSYAELLVVSDSSLDVGVIQMVRAGSISGTVVLPEGIDRYDVAYSTYSWDPYEGVWIFNGNMVPSRVDGSFRTAMLAPGPTLLRFTPFGPDIDVQTQYLDGANAWWDTTPITVAAGQDTAGGEIVLVEGARAVQRLGGADRFAMAVGVSEYGYPSEEIPAEGVEVVFVANGYKFPDALSAGPAATGLGPVLLLPGNEIPQVVRDELLRLKPQRIVIAGGPASISAGVAAELATIAPTSRIGGADRYEVSRSIARQEFGTATFAVIVTGSKFPDALAVGPFAGTRGAPVILVPPTGGLDAATRDVLIDLGVESVYIAGGPASVSIGIEWDLWDVPGVDRVWRMTGEDRYGAAASFAHNVGYPADSVMVAYGGNFPDALAGAWLGGYFGDGIVLAQTTCIPWQGEWFFHYGASMVVLGGPNSLSPAIEEFTICPS
jgi:putative cell wall-binding protein